MEPSPKRIFAATVDLMSLILPNKAYLIWLEIHNPREPITAKEIDQVLQKVTPADITKAVENVDAIMSQGKIFKEAAAKYKK